jgi:NAD(P)-dependent dehydrogenase (short-subunit alcohol dehydrogenase family)
VSEEFSNRVALVTGAGSGIGAASAALLARRGARVVVVDIRNETATRVATQITSEGGQARPFAADATDPAQVKAAVEFAQAEFGALHHALNNVGGPGQRVPIVDYDIGEWRRMIGLNLDSIFFGLKYEIPAIVAAGGGSIVNIASIMGINALGNNAAYIAAKHGIVGLTKAAALENATSQLRVNAIAPGFIDTPLIAGISNERRAELTKAHAMQRFGTPQEIAELATFLLSDRASFITGSLHLADGGYSAQ